MKSRISIRSWVYLQNRKKIANRKKRGYIKEIIIKNGRRKEEGPVG